jgi:hypothetical protein
VSIPTSKKCPICGKNKKLVSYYTHREYIKEHGYDKICKTCVKDIATSKEGLIKYCNMSERKFEEELWIWAENKTNEKLKNDAEYNSLTKIQQEKIFNEKTVNSYFSQMNQTNWYLYVSNENQENIKTEPIEVENDIEIESEPVKKSNSKKVYSSKWGGTFSEEELNYLEEQYLGFQNDYELKTKNDHEYAMNAAYSGLIVRKTREEYFTGVAGADKRYKEAVATYDSICTSAKFNQKTRTENSATGLGSYGETWKILEEMGFQPVKVTFPRDDVDKILEEYAHSHVALRGALDDNGES